MLLVGALVTRAALWRAESRGTHFRMDAPEPDDAFAVHDLWQRGRDEPTTVVSIAGQGGAVTHAI